VVDQDVEPALALLDVGDDSLPGALAGDVVVQIAGLAALLADRRGQFLALDVLQVGDDDCRAFLGQPFGAGRPDAARAAGDQRHLALDLAHLAPPPDGLVWLRVLREPRRPRQASPGVTRPNWPPRVFRS